MAVRRKPLLGALALAFIAVAEPSLAQVPEIAVGAVVKDMAGAEVGAVTAINGATVLVRTDRHEIQLPASSMAPHDGAFLIMMSRAQLNAAVDQMLLAAQPSPAQSIGAGAVASAGAAATPQPHDLPATPVSAPQPK
jgi:hypothetical protein